MTRRYGQWAGNERGIPENPDRCVAEVAFGWVSKQCSRKRGHGTDGLLCTQHAKQQASGASISIPGGWLRPPVGEPGKRAGDE